MGTCGAAEREAYDQRGIAGLTELQVYRPTSDLAGHAAILEAHVLAHPQATPAQACATIEDLAQPDAGERLPHGAQAQARLPRPGQGRPGAVYFVDAAHVVLAPFLGFLWSVAQMFLRAEYPLGVGRRRFNVLGRSWR